MRKLEFLAALNVKLSGLPKEEVKERINFYSEMIDDRIEDGLSEEEAVFKIGSVDSVARQIAASIPIFKIAKEKIKPKRRLQVFEIVLLIIGSPIWLSLLIAAFAVAVSLYAALFSVIVSLWAAFISLAIASVAGILAGPVLAILSNTFSGVVIFASGILCLGLSGFAYLGCIAATKGILVLAKNSVIGMKSCFLNRRYS